MIVTIREDGTVIPTSFTPSANLTILSPGSLEDSMALMIMGAIARQPDRTDSTRLVRYPTIRMQLRSMEFGESIDNFGTQYPEVDTSGVFTFTSVPPGRYRIQTVTLPENAYVADMRIGGKSVYDNGFIVGGDTDEIQVIVNSSGAQIQGAVLDAMQKPFAFARIALVPTLRRRQNIALFKTAAADADGNYMLRGIAPGEYKLFAWEPTPSNISLSPDFITEHEAQGESITVSDGRNLSVDLKLLPLSENNR
jgi:hypothetical protein